MQEDAEKVVAAGYPKEMQEFLLGKINAVREETTAVHEFYMAEAAKPERTSHSETNALVSDVKALDETAKVLDATMKDFANKTGGQITTMIEK